MSTPTIARLDQHAGNTVTAQGTLVRVDERRTQLGDRYKVISVADYTDNIRVYTWENSGFLDRVPSKTPAHVQADLYVRRFQGEVIANLRAIRELDAHEVGNAAALLPLDRCPPGARPALAKLVAFVESLEPQMLRDFLNRVLLDPRIGGSIATCKGSQRHHHREEGGLLTHSVEVMEIAGDMARSRLDPVECAITQVAALLHDLGKLRTVGAGTVRPIHYLLASHEAQTSRLLDPHMEWLRERDPALAAGLDYTLGFLERSTSERGQAQFLAGELVQAADRMSAALGNHRRLDDLLTKTLPNHRRATDKQRPLDNQRAVIWI
jgi:hypothetical protein